VTAVAIVCFVLLSLGAIFTTIRMVIGPSLADRVIAADLLLTIFVMGIAIQAARTGDGLYLPVMIVVALVGFLGTSIVARLIEKRGG
jgi:multicomponent Na+:H+ antiporter subunit F